jgi:hypothetical protein
MFGSKTLCGKTCVLLCNLICERPFTLHISHEGEKNQKIFNKPHCIQKLTIPNFFEMNRHLHISFVTTIRCITSNISSPRCGMLTLSQTNFKFSFFTHNPKSNIVVQCFHHSISNFDILLVSQLINNVLGNVLNSSRRSIVPSCTF